MGWLPLAAIWSATLSVARGDNLDEYPDLYEASIQELGYGLDSGKFTSVDLVTVRLECFSFMITPMKLQIGVFSTY